MLNLSAFNHNHHASRVKMVAKFIRRGIRVLGNMRSCLYMDPMVKSCFDFCSLSRRIGFLRSLFGFRTESNRIFTQDTCCIVVCVW